MKIQIRKAVLEDYSELAKILELVIKDNFRIEGVEETLAVELKEEIDYQKKNLYNFLEDPNSDEFFLNALVENRISGLIAFGKINDLIKKHSDRDLSSYVEVKSFYILPEFQKKGIGSLLFDSLINELSSHKISKFCLDCGYQNSQPFWIKKIGEPDVIVQNLWGDGIHHMIWYKKIIDFEKRNG